MTSGRIFIDGVEITDSKVDVPKVRSQVGITFEHFNLFPHKTVLENITLGPIKI